MEIFRFRGINFKNNFVEGVGVYQKGPHLVIIKDDLTEEKIKPNTQTISTREVNHENPTLAFIGDILEVKVNSYNEYVREHLEQVFLMNDHPSEYSIAYRYGEELPEALSHLNQGVKYSLRARTPKGKWIKVTGVREVEGGILVLDAITENWVGVMPDTLSAEVNGSYSGDIVRCTGHLGEYFYCNDRYFRAKGTVIGNKWDNPELLDICGPELSNEETTTQE